MSNDSRTRGAFGFARKRASRFTSQVLPALLAAVLGWPSTPATADPVCDITRTCCANPGGGSPCGGAGATTQGNASGTQQGAGNPINVVTGNKYQQEVDLPALPGVLGLEVVRHYNSATSGLSSATGILGRGWKLSYEAELSIKTAGILEVVQADGSTIVFSRLEQVPQANTGKANATAVAATSAAATAGSIAGAAIWSSADPAQGRITSRPTAHGNEYRWRWSGAGDPGSAGRELLFDERGKLVQISAPTGEFVSLRHDAQGWLVQVTDPQGRSLHLNYLDRKLAAGDRDNNQRFRGVQSIDTPVGRIAYAYNDYGTQTPERVQAELAARRIDKLQLLANLVKVSLPTHYEPEKKVHAWANRGVSSSSVARLYHYEDPANPTLLTGISVSGQGSDGRQMLLRIATYGYDAYGRANLSVRGEPARLASDAGGKTVEPKRLAAGTGIEQVALIWPKAGEVALTNALGQTTRYRTVKIAGQPRIAEVRGPGCASCGPSNVRYGYDKAGRLVDETTLSSVADPIQTTRSERDDHGRILKVSRIDYRQGKAQAPRWVVRYEYASDPEHAQPVIIARPSAIKGKEHLLRIAYNGFGQTTQTTEEGYSPIDDKGQLAAQGTPISRSTRFNYQSIKGRSLLTQIDGPLANGPTGSTQDSDITRAVWDNSGSYVIGWTTAGGFASSITYDPNTGLIATVKNSQGAESEFTHDSMGQLVRVVTNGPGWTRPYVHSIRYDALGHSTEVGTGSDRDESYRVQARHEFDVAGRLLWSAAALGVLQHNRYDAESRVVESGRYSSAHAQVTRYAYDPSGRITQVTDPNGSVMRIGYDERGRARSLNDPSGQTHAPAAGPELSQQPRVLKLRDDFGRIVATLSPDSGTSIHRFDEANRLVAGIDALGNSAAYDYDAAGRIVRQWITDKRTGQTVETRWRYAGSLLVALEHPTQSERYEHDQRGLLVAKVVKQKREDGSELTSITRYGWDDAGVLQSVSLPDGSRVLYQRNGQGQVVALQRSRIRTSWLQWLLPTQTLVKDLRRDVVGVKSYVAGNGIEARMQRSREGTLARIAYRNTREPASRVAALSVLDILGIASAKASAPAASATPAPPAQAASTAAAPEDAKLPGALSQPADLQAFIDHRYLWNAHGNLLFSQAKAGSSAYAYDARGRLILANASETTSRYHYDAAGRRVLAQEGAAQREDLQTNTRKASYQDGTHRWLGEPGQTTYDAAGQPSRVGQREYVWDATGHLIEVRQEDRSIARYRYSHRGERIGKTVGTKSTGYLYDKRQLTAELDARGRITRQYVYLADQPIAVIDTPHGRQLIAEETGVLQSLARDLRIAVSAWFASDERMAWLHANHLGAVEAGTDEQGQIVWQASYAPFGAARIGTSELVLNLRLPGQYEDAETGLYYNKHRYYDPSRGEYLTPDPLGTPDGPNPYAYVRHNPLRYVDASGLILFAFDGTNNTDDLAWLHEPGQDSSLSNVVQFRDAYDDGGRRYVTGVGTLHRDDIYGDIVAPPLDRGFNLSGPDRILRMLVYLMEEAENLRDDDAYLQIDIVGFSRGAAEARDFANLVSERTNAQSRFVYDEVVMNIASSTTQRLHGNQCVQFRFMGLFDTVLSQNNSGRTYQLGIPTRFEYVAQAVALNEYRSGSDWNIRNPLPWLNHWGAFPLESIGASSNRAGAVRIERGFIGAHADIGGGYSETDNQLSAVALHWMVAQAQIAGVNMRLREVSIPTLNPVIHDQSNAIRVGNPMERPSFVLVQGRSSRTVAIEDRQVRGATSGATQRTMRFNDPSMTNADTHQFIQYSSDRTAAPREPNNESYVRSLARTTGKVDVNAYMAWLRSNGYCFTGDACAPAITPVTLTRRRVFNSALLVVIASCKQSASHAQPLSEDDKALAHKFRGITGGELRVDAISKKIGVKIFNERGDAIYSSAALSLKNNSRHTYTARFGVPKFIRVEWLDEYVPIEPSASNPAGGYVRGKIIGNYTVPVASRFPDDLLDKVRASKGGLRFKIRIHDDGPLIGWDLYVGVNQSDYAGGDFREAHMVYEGDPMNPTKRWEKGWYIHPKTGQRIETDF